MCYFAIIPVIDDKLLYNAKILLEDLVIMQVSDKLFTILLFDESWNSCMNQNRSKYIGFFLIFECGFQVQLLGIATKATNPQTAKW